MKPARQLCVLTIASVSVATALLPSLAGAAGRRQPVIYPQPSQQAVAGTFMSLEGGLACQFDGQSTIASGEQVVGVGGVDTLPELARSNFNGNNCGWTGRIGFGQERVQILGGMFDSWAIFGRHTEFGDHKLKASGAAFFDPLVPGTFRNDFTGKSDANRTVIDLEVGKNLGTGTGIRVFGGLRYARFEQTADRKSVV